MTPETVLQEYQKRLLAFLHSRVSNEADVEDLFQQISLKTLTGLRTLEDPAKVQSWLFQLANRTVIDHYRARAKAGDVNPDDLWYAPDDPSVRQDLEHCVSPFLAALPEDTARLLRSIDLEGQTQKQVAESEGLPYSTLKSRVQAARDDLRALFDNCCKFSVDARGNISDFQRKSDGCKNC